jgi:type IX secretion system PorP/SprF family membrane protein
VLKLLRYIVLFIFFVGTNLVYGQDVSFSQFYTNPLYLNPAFAGSIGVPRVALQYRNQWHSFSNAYDTYGAAADFPVKKMNGGLGFNFINDAQANGALNTYSVNAAYSVHLRLSENYWFNGGLQVGYNQNSLNVSELIFADNLDANYGDHGISQELISDPNYSYVDFSTGILVYSSKLFFGLAAHHLTEPNQSFVSDQYSEAKLERKYTAHFGARLPVYLHGHNRKKFDVSPQLILQSQGEFQQINYGLFAAKRGLATGVWFRQNFGIRYDAVILLVGFVRKKWQCTYSYDITVSGLGGSTGGTSEVSVAFLLGEIKKRKSLPFFDKYEEEFGEF